MVHRVVCIKWWAVCGHRDWKQNTLGRPNVPTSCEKVVSESTVSMWGICACVQVCGGVGIHGICAVVVMTPPLKEVALVQLGGLWEELGMSLNQEGSSIQVIIVHECLN